MRICDMKNIKIIVTDLDNTLLRKDKTTSDYTKSIIKKCIDNGLPVVFATARPERATRQWQIDKKSIYVIANNGATITHNKIEIMNIAISEATKHNIIKKFVSNPSVTGITAEVGAFLYTLNSTGWVIIGDDGGWNAVLHDFTTPIKEDLCKLCVECKSPEIVSNVLANFPDLRILPNSGEDWHMIMHKSVSKLNAISYLANIEGIALQDVMAFGDDYNDVEMLKGCGVGVAVENAVAEAKQAADYICESNDEDGVARYIEKYVIGE